MINKKSTQIFALIVSIVMFTLLIWPAFASQREQGGSFIPTPTPSPDLQGSQPVVPAVNALTIDEGHQVGFQSEVVERRTATSKHYRLGPNLYQAHISSVPIHYKDATGNWQEIDTRPVVQPDGSFRVDASNIKMVFPYRLDQTGLELNATIYPAAPERTAALDSSREKPDPITLFNNSTDDVARQDLPPIEVAIQWQPQYLAYANNLGLISSVFQLSEATARTVDDGVEYVQVQDNNVSLNFQASESGFVQRVRLSALPDGVQYTASDNDATRLEYAVRVRLPSDVQLYSGGAQQTGNFTTNVIELRDQIGNSLVMLPAPHLSDQVVSQISPPTQYRVEPTLDGMTLIAELPLDWLTDPAREFPVTVESFVIFPNATLNAFLPIWQDDWMWQCSPTGGLNNLLMWTGHFDIGGGCSPGAQRALAQWIVTSLPPSSMIGRSSVEGPTLTRLYRRPASDFGAAGTVNVGTHRMFVPWQNTQVTWLQAANGSPWSQPGAEDDYLVATEDEVGVSDGDPEGYLSMGLVDSLVGAWHTHQSNVAFPWGDPNFGVMYKSTAESGPNMTRAYDQIAGGNFPQLFVTYLTNTFFNLVADTQFFQPRAPSPDLNRIVVSGSEWGAVGIRAPGTRSDYDLFLSTTSAYTQSIAAFSVEVGNTPDIIVINPDVTGTFWPWMAQWEGTGLYYLRYGTQSGDLVPTGTVVQDGNISGQATINGTVQPITVLIMYRVNLTTGKDYEITLDVTSGDADLGMALFPPTSAGGSSFMTRSDALAVADSASFGGSERMVGSPPTSDWYGLLVFSNGSLQDSDFVLNLKEIGEQIFLPSLVRSFTPPAGPLQNSGFEDGSASWSASGPGAPLIASVVANPSPGCFPGSLTGRLGTPGQLANGTIPIGQAKLAQRFDIPPGATQLTFDYQAFSYDVIKGSSSGRFYDRFNVLINGTAVFTDGNPAGSTDGQSLWQSGCKTGTINVSAYAGQPITLDFAVYNLVFPDFNTWAYVDDVKTQ